MNTYNSATELAVSDHLVRILQQSQEGNGDSDRHALTLFAIAHASGAKTLIELGVREGGTTLPLLLAAHLNGGILHSVDLAETSYVPPGELAASWQFHQADAIEFLEHWPSEKKVDFAYVDDWHAFQHVKRELELLDRLVGPSSVIILHDLMYGHHEPFYHSDIAVQEGQWAQGGPYRAVAELDPNFWEFSTLPWNNGLTLLRKKYSSKFHPR